MAEDNRIIVCQLIQLLLDSRLEDWSPSALSGFGYNLRATKTSRVTWIKRLPDSCTRIA